jgi:SH3 domain-containing YSC84-like protein 1
MHVVFTAPLAAVLTVAVAAADLSSKATNRIREAATILKEIHAIPDKDIPQDLWDKAECVIVVPSLKKAPWFLEASMAAV